MVVVAAKVVNDRVAFDQRHSHHSCRGTSRRSGRDPEVAPRELDEGMEAGSSSPLVVRLHHLRRASTSRRSRGKSGVQEC